MLLLQLDSNRTVVARTSLADITALPINTPLDESYIIVGVPIEIGQHFDPETKQFAPKGRRRWLTKLAFDNRFTMTESVGLKLAQVYPGRLPEESDPGYAARCVVPAQLQVMSERRAMAAYIDLDRADTRAGVQQLEAMGLIAAGRAAEILDDPIAQHEYHPDA